MVITGAYRPFTAPALLAAALLTGGCGQALAASAPVAHPSPIPTVDAYCAADYPWYDGLDDAVTTADVIVRVTAGTSRDYDVYPRASTETDPRINPQAGLPPEAIQQIPPLPGTALSVTVTEVIKGDVAVGDVFEVNQNACTARPLPTGPDSDYVLLLRGHEGEGPMGQLNDDQAAYQVASDRSLAPVNPANDLGVDSIDDLTAAVAAQAPTA